jgi:hypothetical protein
MVMDEASGGVRRSNPLSPDERDQPVANVRRVIVVPRQSNPKGPFLKVNTDAEQNEKKEHRSESPPGTQQQGCAEKKSNGGDAHGMAGDPIGAGSNDPLPAIALNFDDG